MRARIAASILVGAVVAFGATGCAFITPQETVNVKETSNGVNGDAGDIAVRNATLLTNNDGRTASLLVSFVNQGQRAQQVSVQYKNTTGQTLVTRFYVPAGGTKSLGNDGDEQLVLKNIDAAAGTLFSIYFQSEADDVSKQLLVPVLQSDWQEYQGLQPPVTALIK